MKYVENAAFVVATPLGEKLGVYWKVALNSFKVFKFSRGGIRHCYTRAECLEYILDKGDG